MTLYKRIPVLCVPNPYLNLRYIACDQGQRLNSSQGQPQITQHNLSPRKILDSSHGSARVAARLPCSAFGGILRWHCSEYSAFISLMDSDRILRKLRRGGLLGSFGRGRCITSRSRRRRGSRLILFELDTGAPVL